jgi:maltooligosyltrehalose trehalohydrolase
MGFWEHQQISIAPDVPYEVMLDGKSYPDPASLWQPDGTEGKSVAFDLSAYNWKDTRWQGIAPDELIIYELHTGTFTSSGTLDAISEKLEYLKELGISAIELMPVAQFPGSRNWGYDGVFPFAVQNTYGGPAELQRLVDNCHQNGIAVILDVVFNHLGPENNYLPFYGPCFTDKYKTPWGQAINYDDAWSDGVRLFFIENALMWLRDFHIDGLRLDAIHAIKDFGPKNILQEIAVKVFALNQKSTIHHFLIGESDLNDIKYIKEIGEGGFGLDATWCDEFHHALHALATGENNGYYSDFGRMEHLVKASNEGFVFNGTWSEHRKKIFGTETRGFPGHKFVVFGQNHDQVGNRMMGDRLSVTIDFEKLKLVAGAVLFSPFIPLLFMGEEYAETHPFLYFTSHKGANLIRMVREGRKNEFGAFSDEGDTPDPQATTTFKSSMLNWEKRTLQQKCMLEYYQEIVHLRKTIPLWKSTNRSLFSAKSSDGENVLQLMRKNQDQVLLALLNFEDTPVSIITCETYIHWQLMLNSYDSRWGGPGGSIDIENPSVIVPAHAMIVLYSS